MVGGVGLFAPAPAFGNAQFSDFLDRVASDAASYGISRSAINGALRHVQLDEKVLYLDQHQPEFTLTWEEYEAKVLTDSRFAEIRASRRSYAELLDDVSSAYGVDAWVILGIWGLESDFGRRQGTFNIFQALATLAYDARRHDFFRSELIDALRIVDRTGVDPALMTSSYAGAMGQPQFMPSAYLHYARPYRSGGGADIWHRTPDVFSSVANYLSQCGWRQGEGWGQEVNLAAGMDHSSASRPIRSISEWRALGIEPRGGRYLDPTVRARLVVPDPVLPAGYLVTHNFEVIRRYNPSDFYALAVGLLGDHAT